jgi:hypothetical protein
VKDTWLADAIAALTDERRQVATRLDAIDLALDNLRRLTPADQPAAKTVRTIKERRVVDRRHGTRRAGKETPISDQAVERANAAARSDAVVAFLRRNAGVATSKALRAAMPSEPQLTDEQRTRAFSNTLTRLKAKKILGRTGDTWSLVGRGTEASS